MELRTPSFNIKRIHNIRDFAYRVELEGDISVGDLAFVLNSLTDEAFFWSEGEDILHATSEVNWQELLPQELKEKVKTAEVVKEGYLEHSKLPLYTAFALIVADVNKLLSSNFKANPLFRRLRKRTKEGWNLSLWQKFLHNFSLKRKERTKNGLELQIWRWFDIVVENDEVISLPLRGGIAINENFEKLARRIDPDTLKEFFAFRIKGTYRVGYASEIDPEGKTVKLNLGGVYTTVVPFEKLVAIYLPERDNRGWKDRDRLKLLKDLRLPTRVICQYTDLLNDAVNKLLEPYMISLSEVTPRGERVKISTNVVVDKPVSILEVASYVVETGKVYSNPFENGVRINLIDLFERSEKNKKLLRDAKEKFLEDLKGFFEKLGVTAEVNTFVWDQKVKSWDLTVLPAALEFLKNLEGELKEAHYNLVVLPESENVGERIFLLSVINGVKKFVAPYNGNVLSEGWLKLYLKTAKDEKRASMLLEVLRDIFLKNGGALYILDEPLPFGRVAVETESGYIVFNLFGEPVEFVPSFTPAGEDDLVISFSEREKALFMDKKHPLHVVNVEDRCSDVPKGVYFTLGKKPVYTTLEEGKFAHSVAFALRPKEVDINPADAVKTVHELKKVFPL